MYEQLDFCRMVFQGTRYMQQAFQDYMSPIFSDVGLKPLEGSVLAELGQGGAQSVSTLCAATSIRPTNISSILRDLEDKGLITRGQDPEDARSSILDVADEGRAVLARIDEEVAQRFVGDASVAADLQRRIEDGFDAFHALALECGVASRTEMVSR